MGDEGGGKGSDGQQHGGQCGVWVGVSFLLPSIPKVEMRGGLVGCCIHGG